jgi:ribosomal protein S18 acetylase RimI-like enzyme
VSAIELDGLVKRSAITDREIQELEQLIAACQQREKLHLYINKESTGGELNHFFYYQHGQLIGCLMLDTWNYGEKETTLFVVHPEYRRRGIGRTLLAAAQEECVNRGLNRIVLVCERDSYSGQRFVQSTEALYNSSEHAMQLRQLQEGNRFDERLSLRLAGWDDLEALVKVKMLGFSMTEERSRKFVLKRLENPQCQFYLATLGGIDLGCDEPVGTLRLDETAEQIGIYGFCVVPEYQGRGYGRQILEETIRLVQAQSQKPITLDVDVENQPALGLYLSSGFEIKTTFEYWVIDL